MLPPPLLLVALSGAPLATEPPPPPDVRAWAFAVGSAIDAVSFAVGVALIGSDGAGFDQARAGWLTCSFGFTLGPFVAHAIEGEWLRGAFFSALPLVGAIGNAFVLLPNTDTIDQTPLKQDQRLIWAFTSVGLAASVAGLLDVAITKPKALASLRVTPSVSQTGGGLTLGGTF